MTHISSDYTNISVEFNDLRKELEGVVDEEVRKLYSELRRTSPVLSGEFKGSWTPVSNVKGSWLWEFKNKADHASILARGREQIGGRWYGSNKGGWGGGIKSFFNRFELAVERRTK